jgi:hypothetical protein
MITRKAFGYLLVLLSLAAINCADAQSSKLLFKQSPGIVSYTYRKSFEKDIPGTLDIIKKARHNRYRVL